MHRSFFTLLLSISLALCASGEISVKWINDGRSASCHDAAASATPLPFRCRDAYVRSGSIDSITAHYDHMKQQLTDLREEFTDGSGLVTATSFIDAPSVSTAAASAYYYRMARMMEEFAALLGLTDDAAAWARDARTIKDIFNSRYLTVKPGTSKAKAPHPLYPDSIFYCDNSVRANLLPLAFGMVPEECVQPVTDNLITAILVTNKGRVDCDPFETALLLQTLSQHGRGDVASKLAYDMASDSPGSLHGWAMEQVGGIIPGRPGYGEVLLSPGFALQDVVSAEASVNTPQGTVESRWSKTPKHIRWTVNIPQGVTATVKLPTADSLAISDGRAAFAGAENGFSQWTLAAGGYDFDIPVVPSARTAYEGVEEDEFLFTEAPFAQCHASTIAEMPDGTLVAAYFAGTKERNPDCCIWVSRKPKGSDTWTAPEIAADGVFDLSDPDIALAGLSGIDASTTPASEGPVAPNFTGDIANSRRKACWNPVLFRIPGEDELLLFYKIGSSVTDWTGWVARSKDGGKTWSRQEPLPKGILGPIKNKPEYIDGRLLCPSSREDDGWRAWMEYSDDKGKTWHATGAIPSELRYATADTTRLQPIYAIQPSIIKLADGRLQILCRTRNAKIGTSFSSDNGATWTDMTLLDMPNNQSGTDAVTLADGRHVLIYNDFETIMGTPKGPRNPLDIAVSDDGEEWTHVVTLEDSPAGEFSYPCIIQGRDGSLHALYTWRRQTVKHVKLRL